MEEGSESSALFTADRDTNSTRSGGIQMILTDPDTTYSFDSFK